MFWVLERHFFWIVSNYQYQHVLNLSYYVVRIFCKGIIYAKLKTPKLLEMKPSRICRITLPSTDVGKSCTCHKFLTLKTSSHVIRENKILAKTLKAHIRNFYTPQQTLFVVGILFSRCPCVRPSVTLCFLNIFKSHCWIFIKPCKHVHICKTNTLNKKVRARGQFY